jgi:hypothetical protein
MARITTNTTGTQPTLYVSTDTANVANAALSVICLQDITITNSTGIFSWTDFCSIDTNKVTTPADNEITTNVVLDAENWFGNASAGNTTAAYNGISGLSINKIEVAFQIVMNGDDTTANAFYYEGVGYISALAPTVSPEAPVWVSPLTIAVDGAFTTGQNP